MTLRYSWKKRVNATLRMKQLSSQKERRKFFRKFPPQRSSSSNSPSRDFQEISYFFKVILLRCEVENVRSDERDLLNLFIENFKFQIKTLLGSLQFIARISHRDKYWREWNERHNKSHKITKVHLGIVKNQLNKQERYMFNINSPKNEHKLN